MYGLEGLGCALAGLLVLFETIPRAALPAWRQSAMPWAVESQPVGLYGFDRGVAATAYVRLRYSLKG